MRRWWYILGERGEIELGFQYRRVERDGGYINKVNVRESGLLLFRGEREVLQFYVLGVIWKVMLSMQKGWMSLRIRG